ncbi:MAG: PQQ-dependent sugar dehydrogenase [Acidobacteria bacterium]|nr:PQQ-dependent sugar dehydrogenase [Acidobacteriota bacterium]
MANVCQQCHGLDLVTSTKSSPEVWRVVVDQMISYGALLSEDDSKAVVEYLAKNFGPNSASAEASSARPTPANPASPDRGTAGESDRFKYPSAAQIKKDGTAVLVEDYASLPLSSLRLAPWVDRPYPPPVNMQGQLGRVNMLRAEPPDAPRSSARFFVVDQNGVLYILDKTSKQFTPYIDIGKVFGRFNTDPNLTNGIASMVFDPDYAKNGKFYTVHTENPKMQGSQAPSNASLPGLNLSGFKTTEPNDPPAGEVEFQSVLTEWTDTNIGNSTFEGTSREVLRVGFNQAVHPMYEALFNPLARPGDPDYGNLYISVGDGGAGALPGVTHPTPQRLDALQGKLLRITPDLNLRKQDLLSSNGRYRIPSTGPDPNPFVAVKGARPEVYAYGFRSPIRISFDPVSKTLFLSDIGNSSWEEVNVIVKGGNYGWAEREGHEQHFVGGPSSGRPGSRANPQIPFPSTDTLSVEGLEKPVTPLYPAALFSHRDGWAVGTGYVYRGKLMPQLVGKFIFTEIVSGRLFYADLEEMLATRGIHKMAAEVHEIQVVYKNPDAKPGESGVERRMYDIVKDAFYRKGGVAPENSVMPDGSSDGGVLRTGTQRGRGLDPYGIDYGGGRADVRLSVDGDGELYAVSKTDGMVRKIVSVVTPPPAKRAAGN